MTVGEIFKIFSAWVKLGEERKGADIQKYNKILTLLPAAVVTAWCENELWNAYYHRDRMVLLDNFNNYLSLPSSRFNRRKLRNKFKSLIVSYSALHRLLAEHFFINKINNNFVELNRDMKGWDHVLYDKTLEELRCLTEDFQKKYNEFVITGEEKYIDATLLAISLIAALIISSSGLLYFLEKFGYLK